MVNPCLLTTVPVSLLLLIADWPAPTQSVELPSPWPRKSLPSFDLRLLPAADDRGIPKPPSVIADRKPVGVRKMSGDLSEMFFPDYWTYDG